MRVSFVISTYNAPDMLRACLNSLSRQTVAPSLVVVADDGSGVETRAVIEQVRRDSGLPIVHIWHPDDGFRLAEIRNKGIAQCVGKSDYVISLDGDLVLHPKFIEDHIFGYRDDRWVQGTRVKMDAKLSSRFIDGGVCRWPWLTTRGVEKRFKVLRSRALHAVTSRTRIYSRRPTGCHQAFPIELLLKCNGFNQDMTGWGAEDGELSARLANAGVPRIDYRFVALALHLFHPERSRDGVSVNNAIRDESLRSGAKRCENGLDRWLDDPDQWLYDNQFS